MEKNIHKKVFWKNPTLPKELIPVLLKKNNTYVLVHVLTHLSILFFTSALLLFLYLASYYLNENHHVVSMVEVSQFLPVYFWVYSLSNTPYFLYFLFVNFYIGLSII